MSYADSDYATAVWTAPSRTLHAGSPGSPTTPAQIFAQAVWIYSPRHALPAPDLRVGLVAALKANAGITAAVGSEIYPLRLPETHPAGAPALLYQVAGVNRHETLDGPSGNATCVLRFGAGSANYLDNRATSKAVRALLDGFIGTLGGAVYIQGCTFKPDSETELEDQPVDKSDRVMFWTIFEFITLYREH
jgi:hypothetical protein